MDTIKWALGGAIGGAIGGAVWVAVAHFLNAEVGWIAWGVGALAGLGVAIAAGGEEGGMPAGVVATGMAVLTIVAAKYIVACIAVPDIELPPLTTEQVIVAIADDIVEERTQAGVPIQWKPGMTVENASTEADYPPDLWQEAKARWDAKGAQGQADEVAARNEMHQRARIAFQDIFRKEAFKASFSLFDILWIVLAAGSAFRLGSGSTKTISEA